MQCRSELLKAAMNYLALRAGEEMGDAMQERIVKVCNA